VIYYTLDGSLPTQSSTLYTGTVSFMTASVVRAVAFTNGWTPSVASVAYYGPPAPLAATQVSRSLDTNSLTITLNVTPGASVSAQLVHRYSFNESSGTTVADSAGGSAWDGTLPNGGTFGSGQLTLAANSQQYVSLPAGIISNYTAVTIDAWASFGTLPAHCFFYGFGNTDGTSGISYIFCQPWDGRIAITTTNITGPFPWSSEQITIPNPSGNWSGLANLHVTAVYNPPAGCLMLYTNGVLVAQNNAVTVPFSSVNDIVNYIGRSLYSGDSYMDVSLDEFRIYNQAVSPGQVAVIHALGPDASNTAISDVLNPPVTPGTNVSCWAVEEWLPLGLSASNVTADGVFNASNRVVRWGPFFGTNAQTLSYQAVGQPGVYPVNASWSMDGVGGSESVGTNIVIVSTTENPVPGAPPQAAAPVFTPGSGSNVPVNVTLTDATPGAAIYFTLDGSLPTPSSTLYTGAVYLASPGVVRAAAFTNGWTPSVASVAYYGPPAVSAAGQVTRDVNTSSPTAPVVTFNVIPGATANCVAVTETLPPGVGAINVSAGGNYVASNNVVLWGPFFGTNAQTLSYQAVGQPGVYLVSASWSVDGVGGGEPAGTNLVIAGGLSGTIPTPPQQVPTPVLTPAVASNLPVTVSISCSDAQAQIYYTTDGTLPTQTSPHYIGAFTFGTKTSLRAAAFRSGYLPSGAALGEYVPILTTTTVSVAHSVSGNGSFLPTVSLITAPQSPVNCYAVVETIPYGLMPSGLSGDGIWDPFASEIRWGPYLDNQPRIFSYNLGGASGIYPLAGQVSFNGYSVATSDAATVQINANYSGSGPVTNLAACATDYLTYSVNINPAPGMVTVTSVTGTVDWGDGTQSGITQPVMTFEKSYSAAGTFPIVVSADWTGYSGTVPMSGHATKTDSVQVVTSCLAPQIVTQPSNQVVLAGSTVEFTVSASSSVPMTYQWYFNTNSPIFSPSAFATLSLPSIAPQSAGFYSVLITNLFGSVTSSVAQLTVVTPLVNAATRNADGSVTLRFTGLPNASTRIWATTNLAPPANWQPIFTNTTTSPDGTWLFTDTNVIAHPVQFYRFSIP
jgi:hypothetical protein